MRRALLPICLLRRLLASKMILQLHIKNIALIEDCTIEFGAKLNVLSGETGAGKSIIIDSLGFALGARADKGLIRHGATSASVEAVFDLTDSSVTKKKMVEMGFDEEDSLIFFRSMTESRSDIRINGRPATLSMLKELGSTLVDILGQHENQSLLQVSSHIDLLDKYGESAVSPLKTQVSALYNQYKDIERRLSTYGNEAERARRIDVLKYQIDEIEAAELQEGEEEALLADRERFRNAEKIVESVGTAAYALKGDESVSIQSIVSSALTSLRQSTSYDHNLEELYNRLDSAFVELKDITDELDSYVESFDFDGATADRVERRVDLIRSMKRKYGASIGEILSNLEKYREEYSDLTEADDIIKDLSAQKELIYDRLLKVSSDLSKVRHNAAADLKREIEFELSQLGMNGSVFEVGFASGEEFLSENGFDRVEFLISPNPGEPVRSLSKIISGGEMSRFMLAMKVITSRLDGIQSLVFDEVDAGISGKIGEVVAEKLALVSSDRQVIAITHLPQVAAMSDTHFLIEKSVLNGVTRTSLLPLDELGVVGEVERLSAGAGEYGALHAKELRKIGMQKKAAIRSKTSK